MRFIVGRSQENKQAPLETVRAADKAAALRRKFSTFVCEGLQYGEFKQLHYQLGCCDRSHYYHVQQDVRAGKCRVLPQRGEENMLLPMGWPSTPRGNTVEMWNQAYAGLLAQYQGNVPDGFELAWWLAWVRYGDGPESIKPCPVELTVRENQGLLDTEITARDLSRIAELVERDPNRFLADHGGVQILLSHTQLLARFAAQVPKLLEAASAICRKLPWSSLEVIPQYKLSRCGTLVDEGRAVVAGVIEKLQRGDEEYLRQLDLETLRYHRWLRLCVEEQVRRLASRWSGRVMNGAYAYAPMLGEIIQLRLAGLRRRYPALVEECLAAPGEEVEPNIA